MRRKPPIAPSDRLPCFTPLGVGVLAFLLYLPTVGYDFTFDDGVIVERNPAVQEWGHWNLIFFSDYWPGAQSALYRPLTILSFALERSIHGSSPAGFHLLNVILHSFVSALVLLIAAELIGSGWAAVLAAALFAVHPIHTEVVSGVVGRAELLSSALALWAFWVYLRRMRGGKAPLSTLAVVLLLFFLALCAKENVIVLPALLLLCELSRRGEQTRMGGLLKFVRNPVFLGSLVAASLFLLLRTVVIGGFRASFYPNPPFVENPLSGEPAFLRLLNAIINQAHGLRLHVFPQPLIADYSYQTLQIHSGWLTPGFLLMAVLSVLVLAVWALRGKSAGNLAFASSWYVLAILPASNILFTVGTIFGERLYYFPSVGFCLSAAVLWEMLADRYLQGWKVPQAPSGRIVLGVALAVLLAFGSLTWLRNPAWQNDLALFRDTVAKAPSNAKARLWLGDTLVRSGNIAESVAEYRKALEIYPEYGAATANMVVPLTRLGRLDEAIEAGEKARKLFPQENAVVLYNLALAYLKAGSPIRFLEYIQRVLKIDPQNDSAHFQLGMYYLQHEGNRQEARKHFAEALRLNPNLPQAALIRSWFSDLR
jgi:tetratricopeptide (TPR) repeat protein